MTMECVVVDQSGTIIDSGIMTIEGIVTDAPFSMSDLKIENLDIPFYSVVGIPKYAAKVIPPFGSSQYYTVNIHLDVDGIGMQNGTLQFSEDETVWALVIADKIIVGSTKENPNYTSIVKDLADI